jgi:hypothetical protein
MQKQSQPQTTNNPKERDASVQIREGRHTPGPWKPDRKYGLGRDGKWQDFKITGPDKRSICSCSPASKREGEQIEANAHLIAAAPELLEALEKLTPITKEILETIGTCDHSVGVCNCDLIMALEKSKTAIAKAKGE